MTSPTYIESRLSETMFRRFEPLWHTALCNLPNETKFDIPDNLAPTTFLARFRDTRISVLKFKYHTYLDTKKLLGTLNGDDQRVLSLTDDGKQVWFRIKGQRGRPTTLKSQSTQTVDASVFSLMSDEAVTALALLVHEEHLKGPFLIQQQLSSQLMNLQLSLNISLIWDETTKTTVLT